MCTSTQMVYGVKTFLLAASFFCCIRFSALRAALGQLVVLNDCVCLGHELRLECTVVGGTNTVWKGSALNGCNNNEIILRHIQFESDYMEACNNGAIVGRRIRQVGLNSTSQLIVHLNVTFTLRAKTIECFKDDGSQLTSIGDYTITNPSPRDPYSPGDLHLAYVDTLSNRLMFSWSPVLPNCSSIAYRIMSVDCGACPMFTLNTTVNCTIIMTNHTNIRDQMCTFSIRSVVCENSTGNQNSSIAVKLKVPNAPEIVNSLPYYSNKLKTLTKLHIQVTIPKKDLFNTSEEIELSTTSHTAILCSDPEHTTERCIKHTMATSSCPGGVCQFEFDDLPSPPTQHDEDSEASPVMAVRGYSSNIIGKGLESNPTLVDKTNTLFEVKFEATNKTFSCRFIGYHGNTTCRIVYGLRDSMNQQSISKKYEVENSSTNHLVMVTLPNFKASLQNLLAPESTFDFVAFGSTETYTIAVEDSFEINVSVTKDLMIIISSVSCITTITVATISVIVCFMLLGKRKQSRQQNNEENEYTYTDSTAHPKRCQRSSDGPVVYADVSLVRTSRGSTAANLAILNDNRVQYAELNHKLTSEVRNTVSNAVHIQEFNNASADDSLNLDSLLIKIRTEVTPNWYRFGLALGISEVVLNLYTSYPPEECIVETLDHWLRTDSGVEPSWKVVADALRKIELYQLAETIHKSADADSLAHQTATVSDELDSDSFLPPPLPPKGLKAT